MRFASLGSGSEGNALLIEAGRTRLLLDCGFSVRDTLLRLERIGVSAEQLSGIVVTHEHGDHIGGVGRLAGKLGLPVWLTHGTLQRSHKAFGKVSLIHEITPHHTFHIGEIEVNPYPVPHDAAEPVQFVFGDGARRLGVLTDTGSSTPHIEATLSRCDALVLECNHDSEMLYNGHYPHKLKQRVAGRLGHLSNQTAAELLSKLDASKLQHLIAAHLSASNNTPELAAQALSGVLGCEPEWIGIATQATGFGWREIA